MHIQKDKRAGLGSHMEKCVFIGYPQGIQITLGDDSQCTVIIVYLTNTDLGDDSQCTRGKAVQLQIKYFSR